MEPSDPPNDRLVRIETALMHLAHDVEALNEAIVAQQREIDAVRRELERLKDDWEREQGPAETRDPAAEKPPHY
jgi:uncharacterized coiled-coil protein SlyX